MLIAKLCQKSRNSPLINETKKRNKRNSHRLYRDGRSSVCFINCHFRTWLHFQGNLGAPYFFPSLPTLQPCRIVNATLVKISERRDRPKRRAALCLEGISFNYFDRHSKIV